MPGLSPDQMRHALRGADALLIILRGLKTVAIPYTGVKVRIMGRFDASPAFYLPFLEQKLGRPVLSTLCHF
jgi:hypothetical protein